MFAQMTGVLAGPGKGDVVTPTMAFNPEQAISSPKRDWLITGATGFTGYQPVEQTTGLGHSAVAVDNLARGKRANLEGFVDLSGEANGGARPMLSSGLVSTTEWYRENLQVA